MNKSNLCKYSILTLSLVVLLSSCNNNTNMSKEEPPSLETQTPEIKYVKEEKQVFKNSDKKKDFEKKYGFGKYSDAIKINNSLGNLVATDFGDYNLGISLDKSDLAPGAVSAYVSYFDKNDKKLENPKQIEYGPIWTDEPKVISNIRFDKLNSESGDMLLVSLSVISENDQYSSYYIYNKYMSLVDYFSFTNSTSNTSVEVTRGNKAYYPDGNLAKQGTLTETTKSRVETEKKFLEELKETYKIKYGEVFQTIDGEKIEVANFPQDSTRVLRMLSVESITNLDSFPSDEGYFKIY